MAQEETANKNKNFRTAALKNTKLLLYFLKEETTKIKRMLLNIINGISGANAIGRVPNNRAKVLGNIPIKIAPSSPIVAAAINKVALTSEPVII